MTKIERLNLLFDRIDEEIGIGPSEEIIDESKINIYINNFISEFKKYKVFEMLQTLNESTNKSLLEELEELKWNLENYLRMLERRNLSLR